MDAPTGPDDARFIEGQNLAPLTGRSLRVRWSPEDAVRLAHEQLVAQGFAHWQQDAATGVDANGWQASALVIGSRSKSWGRGMLVDIIEEVPVVGLVSDLIPGLRRTIAPTLVVAAAREIAPGETELVIMPLTSGAGDPTAAFGAAPRVRTAIEATRQAAEQSEALISVGAKSLGIADPSCPASRQGAKARFGWPRKR